MAPFIALLSLIPLFVAGHFLYELLGAPPCASAARWAYSFLLGAGFASILTFLVSWAGVSRALTLVILLALLVSALHLVQVFVRVRQRPLHGLRIPDRGTVVLLFLLAAGLFIVARVALATGLGHDGLVYWGLKAKALFVEDRVPAVATQLRMDISPVDYPWLLPTVEAWIYWFLGAVDEQALKILFVLSYGLLLITFYVGVRQYFARGLSVVYTVLLGTTPYLASVAAISGYADLPLALYLLAAFLNLHRWLSKGDDSALLIAGVFTGLVVWVKRDGLFYLAAIPCLLSLLLLIHHRRNRAVWLSLLRRFVVPMLLVALPWLAYRGVYGVGNTDFSAIDVRHLMANSERIVVIVYHVLLEWFLKPQSWGILWMIFWLVSILRWKRLRMPTHLFTWSMAIFPPVALAFAFIFVDYGSIAGHLNRNLNRQWLHTAPIAWFFLALQIPELQPWLHDLVAGKGRWRD